jgi:2-dehydropantoate 2-reductase
LTESAQRPVAAPASKVEHNMTAGTDTMRIAVIGAGGVGGSFGAALAKAGNDVTFVARGAHLAAMRARGLSVLGPRGEIHLNPVQATDDSASIGPVDYVMFCVKLWDVESAGAGVRPLVGPTTAVIPLQNGIDASERLIPILGKDAVMGGVAQISAHRGRAGRDPPDRHVHAPRVWRTRRPPQSARCRIPCAVPRRRIRFNEHQRNHRRAVGEIRSASR